MLTPKEIQQISDIIDKMTDEEVEQAIQRVMKFADMEKRISESYQINPMTFSSCEVLQ